MIHRLAVILLMVRAVRLLIVPHRRSTRFSSVEKNPVPKAPAAQLFPDLLDGGFADVKAGNVRPNAFSPAVFRFVDSAETGFVLKHQSDVSCCG